MIEEVVVAGQGTAWFLIGSTSACAPTSRAAGRCGVGQRFPSDRAIFRKRGFFVVDRTGNGSVGFIIVDLQAKRTNFVAVQELGKQIVAAGYHPVAGQFGGVVSFLLIERELDHQLVVGRGVGRYVATFGQRPVHFDVEEIPHVFDGTSSIGSGPDAWFSQQIGVITVVGRWWLGHVGRREVVVRGARFTGVDLLSDRFEIALNTKRATDRVASVFDVTQIPARTAAVDGYCPGILQVHGVGNGHVRTTMWIGIAGRNVAGGNSSMRGRGESLVTGMVMARVADIGDCNLFVDKVFGGCRRVAVIVGRTVAAPVTTRVDRRFGSCYNGQLIELLRAMFG